MPEVSSSDRPNSQRITALLGLRGLLLDGEFAPGEHLSEIPLGRRLGVSRTPLRLALVALEHEGLLRRAGSGRYIVNGFSAGDVADAIELRGVLEGTAARLAAERLVDSSALQPLRRTLADLDAVVSGDLSAPRIFADYVAHNERFHEQLLKLAGSPVLARSLEHVAALPFASPNAFVATQATLPDAARVLVVGQEQHRAIVEAIAAREGARAEAVAREHARLARRNLEHALAADAPLGTLLPGGSLIALPGHQARTASVDAARQEAT